MNQLHSHQVSNHEGEVEHVGDGQSLEVETGPLVKTMRILQDHEVGNTSEHS